MHGFYNCLTVYRRNKIGTRSPEKKRPTLAGKTLLYLRFLPFKMRLLVLQRDERAGKRRKRSLRLDWCPPSFITYDIQPGGQWPKYGTSGNNITLGASRLGQY